MQPGELSDPAALGLLITAESLSLAVISVIVAFSRGGRGIPNLPAKPFTLGVIATVFLSAIGIGAIAAWWGIYIGAWPCGFRENIVAVTIAIAAVVPPIFAGVITRGLRVRK